MDQESPAISKILEYAKEKNVISWDEITTLVGQDFVNSPEMETALQTFNEHKIQVVETSIIDMDEKQDEIVEEDDN